MNLKDLNKIRLNARTDFRMYEARMYDVRHEDDLSEFGTVAIRFIDTYILLEEVKAIYDKYARVRQTLTRFLSGEEHWEHFVEEGDQKPNVWMACRYDIEAEGDRFSLTQISDDLRKYIEIQYERNKAMASVFDKFFPKIQTGVLHEGELIPLSADQEASRRLAEGLDYMEISMSAEAFMERMNQAKQLCEQEADPALILPLFN